MARLIKGKYRETGNISELNDCDITRINFTTGGAFFSPDPEIEVTLVCDASTANQTAMANMLDQVNTKWRIAFVEKVFVETRQLELSLGM